MATIGVSLPTQHPKHYVAGGACYVLFDTEETTVRDLITEKVRAELRKARAGGEFTTSVDLLLPQGAVVGLAPVDELLMIDQACEEFVFGHYLILYNGNPLVDLDQTLVLTGRPRIAFLALRAKDVPPDVMDYLHMLFNSPDPEIQRELDELERADAEVLRGRRS